MVCSSLGALPPSQGPVTAHPHLQGDGKDEVNIQVRPRAPPSGLSPLISTMQMFEQAQEAEKILYFIVKIQARITATLLSSMVPQALGSPAAQPGVDAAPHPRESAASVLGHQKQQTGDFPGAPVVKTLCSPGKRPGIDPWPGN